MGKAIYCGVSRTHRLTKPEATKYRRIREEVMSEIPPVKPTPVKVAIAKLRAMREAKGISLRDLAARTGMTRGHLERRELQKNATLQTLQRYAQGLDCDLEINVVAVEVKKKTKRRAVG